MADLIHIIIPHHVSPLLPKYRLSLALGLTVPVAIFFAARSAVSWRPQLISSARAYDNQGQRRADFLHLSRDEKWLLYTGLASNDLVNVSQRTRRPVDNEIVAFSPDSQFIATISFPFGDGLVYLSLENLNGRQLWRRKILDGKEVPENVHFSPDGRKILCDVNSRRVEFATKDGRPTVLALPFSPWTETDSSDLPQYLRRRVALRSKATGKVLSYVDISNDYDSWEVAPDGLHLWISQLEAKRFDILDAHTGKRLWSYSSDDIGEEGFYGRPHFESNGKTLATIENDTLIIRDSSTGQVMFEHKNNLPEALESWAFTNDQSAVYLMDFKGEIFRQRLR